MTASPVPPRVGWEIATIANAASLSGAVNLKGRVIVGIMMPAAWTTADLTFQASIDGTTYANIFDDEGDEVEVVAAAAIYIPINPSLWAGVRFVKVRSGTSGTPAAQGAEREITLALRSID